MSDTISPLNASLEPLDCGSFSDYNNSTFGQFMPFNKNLEKTVPVEDSDEFGFSIRSLADMPMADSTNHAEFSLPGYEYSTDEGSPVNQVSSRSGSPVQQGEMVPPFSPRLKPKSRVSKWRKVSRAAIKVSSEAHDLWKEAKDLYESGYYSRANVLLTKCIEMQPLPEFLSTRSMTWLQLNNTVAALKDSMQAVERSRPMIEKYHLKGQLNKSEHAAFLEYYFRRGKCFVAQGGVMGSQLAMHDFKIASTQSIKMGFWKGDDPAGWDDVKESIIEEYEDERRQYEELSDEEEWEMEDLDQRLDQRRLGIVLDEITEMKGDLSEVMIDSDDFNFEIKWKSLPMNHTTKNILLPLVFTPETISRIFTEIEMGNKFHRNDFYGLLVASRTHLEPLPNVVDIPVPEGTTVHVVGDLHGQFFDLMSILNDTGYPSETNILIFNGDFVDRGAYGIEVITALLILKCAYPKYMHLVRGNHEDHQVNEQYHFLAEVLLKYGSCDLYHGIQAVFKLLPLAHLIGGKILVVHGGIPGPDVTLEEVAKIDRMQDVPDDGAFCNMLWSDPRERPGSEPSSRGRGMLFGPDETTRFLELNNLDFVMRSHDVTNCVEDGYHWMHDRKIVTVFSAPDYGGCGNRAATAEIDHTLVPKFHQFLATDPPSEVIPRAAPHAYHFNFNN